MSDELLSQADSEVSRYFRTILCEAQAEDNTIKDFSDLIPKSDARYYTMGRASSLKSKKIHDTSKSSTSDDDTTETMSSDSNLTIKKLNKRHKRDWIRETFLQIADLLSHIAIQMIKNPMKSFAIFFTIYFFFFNGIVAKIYMKELAMGLARATEKAITGGDNKAVDL